MTLFFLRYCHFFTYTLFMNNVFTLSFITFLSSVITYQNCKITIQSYLPETALNDYKKSITKKKFREMYFELKYFQDRNSFCYNELNGYPHPLQYFFKIEQAVD